MTQYLDRQNLIGLLFFSAARIAEALFSVGLSFALIVVSGTVAHAKDAGDTTSDTGSLADADVETGSAASDLPAPDYEVPAKWETISVSDNRDVVAVLRPTSGRRKQITLRMVQNLPRSKQGPFGAAFHTEIQRRGFEKVGKNNRVASKDLADRVTEYRLGTEKRPYRLFVFQKRVRKHIWIVTGFFPESALNKDFDTFEGFIDGISW